MIGGLSWSAWLLLVASVGLGLLIVLRFFFRYRNTNAANAPPPGSDR